MTAVRTRLSGVVAVVVAGIAVVAFAAPNTRSDPAREAAEHFLDRYVLPSGRVVRRDQGGDTVSEGQGYALMLSATVGDRRRFERVWAWTRAHLQRPDGLFSWLWRGGRVADRQPATDADIDIAHGLVLGADRFRTPRLRTEAAHIGRAVLARETVQAGGRLVLVAGPWATRGRLTLNPSYFSPRGFAALARATRDPRFGRLEASSLAILRALSGSTRRLPPDWAVLSPDGRVRPSPSPSGQRAAFGYDAVRAPIRMAAARARAARALAAGWWPRLER
ncbi:MAG TPA: glycosyl hydrolase family 8, partial [Thermoleophilaceae bacterium]